MSRILLTQKEFIEKFQYVDGELFRKKTTSARARQGDKVGYPDKNKYLQVRVNYRLYYISVIVWVMHTGKYPLGIIDHIDRDTYNNRIENLRDTTKSGNSINSKIREDNKSGVRGVCWDKGREKWRMFITLNSKRQSLGYHNDFTEAVFIRFAAEQSCGFAKWDKNSSAYQYVKTMVKIK